MNLLKYLFVAVPSVHASGCFSNMAQIYAWTLLSGLIRITHFVCDDVIMIAAFSKGLAASSTSRLLWEFDRLLAISTVMLNEVFTTVPEQLIGLFL